MTEERDDLDLDATIQRIDPVPTNESREREDSGPVDIERTIAGSSPPEARPVPRQRPDDYLPRIPDVTIAGKIGTGGQGVVFCGHQDYLERDVAVKVLHRHVDPSFSKRFQREAKILAGLHHTNIVTCHQAGVTDDDHCYMVMEYIDGPDLFDRVSDSGALEEGDALDLVRDVALALQHGLESSIIHRDVKPQNVLLQRTTKEGKVGLRAKLADLGLARCTEDNAAMPNLTTQGAVMGTPTTMAPEQFDAPDDVDHRADIYGLGCVLFFALTAKPAFEGATITEIYRKKTTREVPRMLAKVPGLSPAVRELLGTMMAPDAKDRPADYATLLEAIERARTGQGTRRSAKAPMVVGSLLSVGAVVAFLTLGGLNGPADMGGDGDDPESRVVEDTDGPERDEPDGAEESSDGERTTPAPPQPTYTLEPAVPAGKSRFPLQYAGPADFLEDWSGAEHGDWMAADGDYAWVRCRAEPSAQRTAIERACPAGAWSLRGRIGNRNTFTNSQARIRYSSGVELERGDGLVLRLTAVYERGDGADASSIVWTWVKDDVELDAHDAVLPVLEELFEKAAFEFEVSTSGDRVLLVVDDGTPVDVTPTDEAASPFVTLRLFVDAGFGSWRQFEFRGL